MNALNTLLKNLNIKPHEYKVNALNTGIVCRFDGFGGNIKVTTTDDNFLNYLPTFAPIKK